ncbi:7791_t:CDS:2, partial [Gigaspora rosea]
NISKRKGTPILSTPEVFQNFLSTMASHPENRPEPMSDIQPTTFQDAIASTNDVITSSQAPPQKKTKKTTTTPGSLPNTTTVGNEKITPSPDPFPDLPTSDLPKT